MPPPDLRPLLSPRSIAVIGASTQAHKIGGMPIRLLREGGYRGVLYPVHRHAAEVQGLKAYPSLAAIGGAVDLAVVAVPAAVCEATLHELASAGTRAAIVFSAGFAETGTEGARLQDRVAAIAAENGIALLGPNCLGAMNLREHMYATFSPVVLAGVPPPGRISMVSQSGAFGSYAFALAREAGIGLRHWISTGNEAGLQVADAIHWLSGDADTDVVLAYIEGSRDLPRLDAALSAARAAGKPVAIIKVGLTAAGTRAARRHTGSDTGTDADYAALFDAHGVHRAHTIGEFLRLGTTLATVSRARARPAAEDGVANALAVLSISGGVGIMMADRAEQIGLALPPMPDEAAQRLIAQVPFATATNPIDVTGQAIARAEVLAGTLADLARCGRYGHVAAFLGNGAGVPALWQALQRCIEDLNADPGAAPLLFSGLVLPAQREWLESHGCLVFEEPADAVEAVAVLARATGRPEDQSR
jgi:acyl-CoA synthetase (NDP forming)